MRPGSWVRPALQQHVQAIFSMALAGTSDAGSSSLTVGREILDPQSHFISKQRMRKDRTGGFTYAGLQQNTFFSFVFSSPVFAFIFAFLSVFLFCFAWVRGGGMNSKLKKKLQPVASASSFHVVIFWIVLSQLCWHFGHKHTTLI